MRQEIRADIRQKYQNEELMHAVQVCCQEGQHNNGREKEGNRSEKTQGVEEEPI